MAERHLNRDVTQKECPWLARTIRAGERVFDYHGCTYGCIASGKAVTFVENETPFFELPRDAVT